MINCFTRWFTRVWIRQKTVYVFPSRKPNIKHWLSHCVCGYACGDSKLLWAAGCNRFCLCLTPKSSGLYRMSSIKESIMTTAGCSSLNRNWETRLHYIDNTQLMEVIKEEGEQVFNKMYNAHWNDFGAFYGIKPTFLERTVQRFPTD